MILVIAFLLAIYLLVTFLLGFFGVVDKGTPMADRLICAITTPFLLPWFLFTEATGTF